MNVIEGMYLFNYYILVKTDEIVTVKLMLYIREHISLRVATIKSLVTLRSLRRQPQRPRYQSY